MDTAENLVCTVAGVTKEDAETCSEGMVVTVATRETTFAPPVVSAASPAVSIVNSAEIKADTTFTITGFRLKGATVMACGKECIVTTDSEAENLVCTVAGVTKEDAETCSEGVVVTVATRETTFAPPVVSAASPAVSIVNSAE